MAAAWRRQIHAVRNAARNLQEQLGRRAQWCSFCGGWVGTQSPLVSGVLAMAFKLPVTHDAAPSSVLCLIREAIRARTWKDFATKETLPCTQPLPFFFGELGTPEFFCHRLHTSMTRATLEDSTVVLSHILRTERPLVGGLSFHGVSLLRTSSLAHFAARRNSGSGHEKAADVVIHTPLVAISVVSSVAPTFSTSQQHNSILRRGQEQARQGPVKAKRCLRDVHRSRGPVAAAAASPCGASWTSSRAWVANAQQVRHAMGSGGFQRSLSTEQRIAAQT